MLFKKIGRVVTALAAFFMSSVAQAGDIIHINALGKEEEELKPIDYDFFTDGPTLLFSDSPEMVYDEGVLYRDTVNGPVRLFFHHVNAVESKKKLAVVVKNTTEMHPVELAVVRQGISEPMYDWLQAGKDAQEQYLKSSGQKPYSKRLGFGESWELLTGHGEVLKHNTLVTGIVDLNLSRPAEISVLMCDPRTDIELFNESATVLPMDEHPLRGTFAKADYHYVVKKPIKLKDDSVYMLKMASSESMIKGLDKTTGEAAIDNGNYGVVYTLDFKIEGKHKVQFLFNPIGGEFAGYGILEYKGKRSFIALPKDYTMGKTIEDMVEIGTLGRGIYRFIWSPPGSANLPVRVYWKSAEKLGKTQAQKTDNKLVDN